MRWSSRLALVVVGVMLGIVMSHPSHSPSMLQDIGFHAWAQQDPAGVNRAISDQATIDEIRNMTQTELGILNEISLTSTKLATQGAYTAMSVFFLGISLVIFGLKLTSKGVAHMGKYFTLMIWALTIPVIALVGIFQFGLLTGYRINLTETDEPFFLLSFLMYVPIGIVVFLLLAQQRIIRTATGAPQQAEVDLIRSLQQITMLKEQGTINEHEFQTLKSGLLSTLSTGGETQGKLSGQVSGSEHGA